MATESSTKVQRCSCGRTFAQGRPEKCDACSRRERDRAAAYEWANERADEARTEGFDSDPSFEVES